MILDANARIGDAWRKRWDSLRLFTPARYDGLPGMPFPAPAWSFPTKDEVADYLEAYAARFDLPVRTGVRVDGLSRKADRYVVTAGDRRFEADHVVVASGAYQRPRVPPFAAELDPGLVQLHSSEYRNPSQLQEGGVLVVGAANSGAEIALEVSGGPPDLAVGEGPGPRTLPPRKPVGSAPYAGDLVRGLARADREDADRAEGCGRSFVREASRSPGSGAKDIAAAGIERVPRTVGVRDGLPVLDDGRALEVTNVIWCTGFVPDFAWIDLPVFDEEGEPVHDRGIVGSEPGLYFVGLFFLYALASSLVGGVGRDAERVAKAIAARSTSWPLRAQFALRTDTDGDHGLTRTR